MEDSFSLVFVIDSLNRWPVMVSRSAQATAEMEDLARVSANPDEIHIASDDEEEEGPVEREYASRERSVVEVLLPVIIVSSMLKTLMHFFENKILLNHC